MKKVVAEGHLDDKLHSELCIFLRRFVASKLITTDTHPDNHKTHHKEERLDVSLLHFMCGFRDRPPGWRPVQLGVNSPAKHKTSHEGHS